MIERHKTNKVLVILFILASILSITTGGVLAMSVVEYENKNINITQEEISYELIENDNEVTFRFSNNSEYNIVYVDYKTNKGDYLIFGDINPTETKTISGNRTETGEKQEFVSITIKVESKDKTEYKVITFKE